MAASLIGKMIWKGTKWVARRRKAKALKKAQSPSKLSKKVTKHSKVQKVRAQIADPKKKFPSAKKIKKSGIKLKELDPKRSRKGISQVRPKKQKQKWHIPKVLKARKAQLHRAYGKGTKPPYGTEEAVPLIEVSPQYSQHVDKVLFRGGAGMIIGSAAGGKIGSELTKKKKIKKNKRASPYKQKKPVRGIQLGAPGTQSGTSRSKRKYK